MANRKIRHMLLVPLLLAACAEGVGPADPQPSGSFPSDTDGDTEGPMPEPGHLWCTRADNATYEDGSGTEFDVVYADDGSKPQGCWCTAQETHDWLTSNMAGNVVPMDGSISLPSDVVNLRSNIYQDARNVCFSLVPDPSFANNCNDGEVEDAALDADAASIGFQFPSIVYGDRDGVQDCTISMAYEVYPSAADCSFIDGSYSFTDVRGTLQVSTGFVDKIIAQPGCLYLEDARIEPDGSGSYEFASVTRGELIHELGIRTGDVPVTLNGYDITTIGGAFDAWEAVQGATSFTLVVRRAGSSVTLTYDLI
ncbi:MAG: hypothetical protein ACE37F_36295 [Nannocystaceae bacterium]|nr:hypothetical protein [bacterium]